MGGLKKGVFADWPGSLKAGFDGLACLLKDIDYGMYHGWSF